MPSLSDEESMLSLPLDVFDFEVSKFDGKICLELAGSLAKLVLDENGMLKPFTKFKLWNGRVGMSYLVDDETCIRYEMNENSSDLKRYPSLFSPDGYTFRAWLILSTKHPLND